MRPWRRNWLLKNHGRRFGLEAEVRNYAEAKIQTFA